MIEPGGALNLSRQCARLGVSRSSQYYRPKGESAENLALMRRMDELHMEYPCYGRRQMMRHLRREGVTAGRHRIRRLMRSMGMEAAYRQPRTTVPSPEHRVYPYLLRGLTISRPDHVWCADITYIPVTRGFFYLVAVMDWASRHVLAWRLSNTMDATYCIEALEHALDGWTPEVLKQRPRYAVHECGVQGARARRGHAVLDGWPGSIPRQYLGRTAVAVAEVRGGLFARASRRSRSRAGHRLVDRVLQQRCAPTQLWADDRRGMLIATAGKRREQAIRRSIAPYAPGAAGGGQNVEPLHPTTFTSLARERRLAGGAPPANLPTSRLPRTRETIQNPP